MLRRILLLLTLSPLLMAGGCPGSPPDGYQATHPCDSTHCPNNPHE